MQLLNTFGIYLDIIELVVFGTCFFSGAIMLIGLIQQLVWCCKCIKEYFQELIKEAEGNLV